MSKTIDIKDYLSLVRRPSRYIGGEVNSIRKDLSKVRLTFGLGFPDAYEVGMSHLGIQILYQILNAREDIACERVFAPWRDMEALLREKGAPLATLESGIPLKRLDIMGFSLQYELSFTNILAMLDLGGIPLLATEREKDDPFVIGGGPAAFNPEPVADFFDAFLLGDGEEAAMEIALAVMEGRERGEARADILRRLASIQGVYVPSFFAVSYNEDGTVSEVKPLVEGYEKITKRVVPDINGLPLPVKPVVPFMETIHDRVSVEISRGCTRGCRFCQAGSIYRPVRERTPENIVRIIEGALGNTGYDEVSLLSLSTGDYTLIEELIRALMSRLDPGRVAVSLPSLRVGTLSARLANEIKRVRKTGFTLAPEAGSERLRKLINKGIKEEDLHAAARDVFSLGWKIMKLYFMIGLPTETDGDVEEIAEISGCVRRIGKDASGRNPQINVSVASFIPKPYTPFQWEPQMPVEECRRKQDLLRRRLSSMKLGFKWHDPKMSFLEGAFARGDRIVRRRPRFPRFSSRTPENRSGSAVGCGDRGDLCSIVDGLGVMVRAAQGLEVFESVCSAEGQRDDVVDLFGESSAAGGLANRVLADADPPELFKEPRVAAGPGTRPLSVERRRSCVRVRGCVLGAVGAGGRIRAPRVAAQPRRATVHGLMMCPSCPTVNRFGARHGDRWESLG